MVIEKEQEEDGEKEMKGGDRNFIQDISVVFKCYIAGIVPDGCCEGCTTCIPVARVLTVLCTCTVSTSLADWFAMNNPVEAAQYMTS